MKKFLLAAVLAFTAELQAETLSPDLSLIQNPDRWTLINREASIEAGVIHLKGAGNEGLAILKDVVFSNGKIEVDLKGKDEQGMSFVGLAFHIENPQTYDSVYFRPFNFRNVERKNHSVQYMSMPFHDWEQLRTNYPGDYESEINPAPDPNGWFHVRIEIHYPFLKVYVNNSKRPVLAISQLSPQKKGNIGFFLGNNSEGWYKNLKISSH